MWYDVAVVLILKDSLSPTFTLIAVAKPWIVESPIPLTCQSLGGSPGSVFSHAITLVTGGPHGLAATAGRAVTRPVKLRSTASRRLTVERGADTQRARSPVTDIGPPTDGVWLHFDWSQDTRWMRRNTSRWHVFALQAPGSLGVKIVVAIPAPGVSPTYGLSGGQRVRTLILPVAR